MIMRMRKSDNSKDPQDQDDLSKDPVQEGSSKNYLPRTQNGKMMAKIVIHFCGHDG